MKTTNNHNGLAKDAKKKRKQIIGSLLLITALLSGCSTAQTANSGSAQEADGNQTQAQSTQAPSSTQTPDQTAQNQASQGQTQNAAKSGANQKDFQMMRMFRSLIMMDKADGLTITKDQAVQMIPVVQESITSGELTSDNKTKLLSGLTDAQKKYLDDAAAKEPMRQDGKGGGGGNDGKGGSGSRPSSAPDAAGSAAGSPPVSPPAAPSGDQKPMDGGGAQMPQGQGGPGGAGAGQGMQQSGQQLLELLQSKTK